MPRLTGLVKPGKYAKTQCPRCKRYFQNVPIHQRTATACKQLDGKK